MSESVETKTEIKTDELKQEGKQDIKIEVDYSEILKKSPDIQKIINDSITEKMRDLETKAITNILTQQKIADIEKYISNEQKPMWESLKTKMSPDDLLGFYEENKSKFLPSNGDSYLPNGTSNHSSNPNDIYRTGEMAEIFDITDGMINMLDEDHRKKFGERLFIEAQKALMRRDITANFPKNLQNKIK